MIKKTINEMPLYHQRWAKNGCSYVEFGNALEGIEESKCQNSICRIIGAENEDDKTLVINQYGNLYGVYFTKFDRVDKIEVIK